MKGAIIRRGKKSWRLKYDLPRDPATGTRRIVYATVKGTKADAEVELRRRLHALDRGVHVDPSALTVAGYLESWVADVAPQRVAPKALERYRGLIRYQIDPHLGAILLQKLRPADVANWHQALRREGRLSTRSIRAAHGVLRTALAHAAAIELVERNVAALIRPPALARQAPAILTADQIADTLARLAGHPFHTIAALALGTGARRGEIAALTWADLDLDAAAVTIERALEETRDGVRVKAPKTAAGRRTVSLPAFAVAALRDHRTAVLELRVRTGAGRLPPSAPVFADLEGEPLSPHLITNRWRRAVRNRKLPAVSFHSLRHSHASALIAAGLDVVTVSRRLGHASPALTLSVYAHLFRNRDQEAAAAIHAAIDGSAR